MPLNSLCFQSTLCPLTKEFSMQLQKKRVIRRKKLKRPLEVTSPSPPPLGRILPGKKESKTNQQAPFEEDIKMGLPETKQNKVKQVITRASCSPMS